MHTYVCTLYPAANDLDVMTAAGSSIANLKGPQRNPSQPQPHCKRMPHWHQFLHHGKGRRTLRGLSGVIDTPVP